MVTGFAATASLMLLIILAASTTFCSFLRTCSLFAKTVTNFRPIFGNIYRVMPKYGPNECCESSNRHYSLAVTPPSADFLHFSIFIHRKNQAEICNIFDVRHSIVSQTCRYLVKYLAPSDSLCPKAVFLCHPVYTLKDTNDSVWTLLPARVTNGTCTKVEEIQVQKLT